MAYLNLDLDFHDHPKVKRLTGLLGRGAEGLLTRLWCYCGKHHCVTGILTGYSGQEVESIIGWWGKPGIALEALVKLGFIDTNEEGLVVHDWAEHSGHLAALKERGRRNARKRWDQVAKHTDSNATSITNSNTPQGRVLVSLSSGTSSEGVREFFNPGLHLVENGQAVRLVALFLACVKTSHRSTTMPAVVALGQAMIDRPTLEVAAIERGIAGYAAECEAADTPASKRVGPLKFFEERRWESYDSKPVVVAEKSNIRSEKTLENL